MATLLPTDLATPATDVRTELPVGERARRWFEVCLVLAVACGSPLIHAIYLLLNGPGAITTIAGAQWINGIFHEATALLLLAYVLSRRGLKFSYVGLRWSARDVGTGLLVAGVSLAAYVAGSLLAHSIHHWVYGSWQAGPTGRELFSHPRAATIPFALFALLTPFFEELIVRAYLMTEVVQLTGSSRIAVLLSIAVQTSYHLYYGWVGAISVSFLFLTFALYFARWRRALPLIVAHAIFDISAVFSLR
jgi:ABC-type arginine/histidine transport system permease subunit